MLCSILFFFFFFNDTATTEIYTLSLHDALPISCPPRVVRGAAAQAATASGVNHTVRLPRARRPASYSAQLVTRCCCLGMWRRQAALALNGTAEIRVSGKEPSSYTAQLPTPTGRSVQQGDVSLLLCWKGWFAGRFRRA